MLKTGMNRAYIVGATSSKSRESIVKFTNSSVRLKLLKGRTILRLGKVNNVFINEDFTRLEKSWHLRKLCKYTINKGRKVNLT